MSEENKTPGEKVSGEIENELSDEKNLIEKTKSNEKVGNPHTTRCTDKEGIEKYLVDYVCGVCGYAWKDCLLVHDYPKQCPRGHINTHIEGYMENRPSPDFIANFINEHYQIIHTRGEFYAFDENKGIWSSVLAETIIGKEAHAILGEKLKKQDMENIKLHLLIIAKKNLDNGDPIQLYGTVKQEGVGIKINFQNGTFFIQPGMEVINGKLKLKTITYSFNNHTPEDYFERALSHNFDPSRNKISKKILDFLWYISNDNVFNFITLLEGLAWPFLPGYPIQQALTLVGPGNNGKSTYLQIIKMIAGKENVSTLTLQQLSNAGTGRPFQIVELENKLVNIADDLPNKPLADTGYYKQLTGGSTVSGERKFGSMFKIENQAKMYFSANKMPEANEDTLAWWRRFCFLILEKNIETPKELPLVLKEFEEEIPDLINFVIFAVLPNMIGKTTFTFADTPELTKKTYENVSNTSIRFAEEKLKFNPEAETLKGDIWEEYQAWCLRHNLTIETERKFWTTIQSYYSKAEEKRTQVQGVLKRAMRGVELIKDDPSNDLESIIMEEKKKILDNYIQNLINLKDIIKIDTISTITTFLGISNYIYEFFNFLTLVKGKGGYGGYHGNQEDKIENFPNNNEPIKTKISNPENIGNLSKSEEPMISNDKEQLKVDPISEKDGIALINELENEGLTIDSDSGRSLDYKYFKIGIKKDQLFSTKKIIERMQNSIFELLNPNGDFGTLWFRRQVIEEGKR